MDMKLEFALKAMDPNISLRDLCKQYGISRPTGYKWKNRFIQEGFKGLSEKSRKPRVSPNQTTEDVICELIKLKIAYKSWGPKKIRELYANNHLFEEIPSLSTVQRILDQTGLVQHRKSRSQKKGPRLQKRIKAEHPNDIWTVDFKGWWYTPTGEKCEPLTVRDLYSKYIFSVKAMESSVTKEVKREFEKIFSIYGLPKVIRSDNGPPFASARSILGLTRLSVWWLALGIELDRITPGTPSENGSHERMHGDIKQELQGGIQGNLRDHQSAFDIWREEYNCIRPHETLEMKTPESVYSKSDHKYNPCIKEIIYPLGFMRRKVNSRGTITFDRRKIFISYALQGYFIGLKENSDKTMSVWFDNLRLGSINLETLKFDRVELNELV